MFVACVHVCYFMCAYTHVLQHNIDDATSLLIVPSLRVIHQPSMPDHHYDTSLSSSSLILKYRLIYTTFVWIILLIHSSTLLISIIIILPFCNPSFKFLNQSSISSSTFWASYTSLIGPAPWSQIFIMCIINHHHHHHHHHHHSH